MHIVRARNVKVTIAYELVSGEKKRKTKDLNHIRVEDTICFSFVFPAADINGT